MASTHYFICRTSPFLVLGPEKWLSHKELAEGKCPIYVFPDSKTAQTVQSSLPSTVKHGSTIRAQEFIEEALQVAAFRPQLFGAAPERGADAIFAPGLGQ